MKKYMMFVLVALFAMAPISQVYGYKYTQQSRGYLPLTEHVIISKSNDGSEVVIECESVFTVHSNDQFTTRQWSVGDGLQLEDNLDFFKDTRYKLYNKNTGERVRVELTLGPVKNRPHFKFINHISDSRREVEVLNQNGFRSVWKVREGYSGQLRNWDKGEAIIVGKNADRWDVFFHGYDATLLNVERNETLPVKRVE